jgi:hypothetical protein
MTTQADIINDVQNHLYSQYQIRDGVTSLNGAITDADLEVNVDDGTVVRKGFIEIDDELIEVSASTSTGTVSVYEWGRGERGTTAAAHADGTKVTVNPLYPRSVIKAAVNEVVASLYPHLWQTVTDESNTFTPSVTAYALPAACEDVISVSFKVVGPSLRHYPITRFGLLRNVNTTTWPTGRVLEVMQAPQSGAALRVVYKRVPVGFTTEADTMATAGLKEQWRDIIRYGVLYRLLVTAENQRLQSQSAEASGRNEKMQPFQALSVSKHYMGLFKARVDEERRLLLNENPGSVVRLT